MWKVLIVEDSIPDQELLKEFLKDVAECDCAKNGTEGYKLYRRTCGDKNYYDAVLLDMNMPSMNGFALASLIRENEAHFHEKQIPLIAITAYKETLKEAVEAGCDDYIVKPVSKDQLIDYVTRLIGKYRDGF